MRVRSAFGALLPKDGWAHDALHGLDEAGMYLARHAVRLHLPGDVRPFRRATYSRCIAMMMP